VIRFIDEHKDRRSGTLVWGIEPIAKTLGIAPSTYHAAKTRPPSTRATRDAELVPVIARVHKENFVAYGADKMWDHLNNVEGIRVARCTVERLMRQMGLSGVRRGRSWIKTTISDGTGERPADLVDRDFAVTTPNRLWLADLTYVKTHTGWVYVAFIIDAYSRMIVGWQASRSLRTDLAIDALEMAVFNRRQAGADLTGLVHHSDMGSQGEIIGPPQLPVLLFQPLDPRRVIGGGARTNPLVDVGLGHPGPHRLHPIAELVGDTLHRPMPFTRLLTQLTDQTHRLILLLPAIPPSRRPLLFVHNSILVPKLRSLQQTQCGS